VIMEAASRTDIGMRRTSNQDSIFCDPKLGLFIVCDGLGGHNGGEVASSMAVQLLSESLRNFDLKKPDAEDRFRTCIEEAGRKIFDRAQKEPTLSGMGTTVTAAVSDGERLLIAQIGDSRAYLIRSPHLWQITEDHSLVQEQVRAGLISLERARSHQYKNVITRSLGNEAVVQIDIFSRDMLPGEQYILCSDGLTGHVNDRDIIETIQKSSGNWSAAVNTLVDMANSRGGEDNCSVVLFSLRD
jgi:protein phosphatase